MLKILFYAVKKWWRKLKTEYNDELQDREDKDLQTVQISSDFFKDIDFKIDLPEFPPCLLCEAVKKFEKRKTSEEERKKTPKQSRKKKTKEKSGATPPPIHSS